MPDSVCKLRIRCLNDAHGGLGPGRVNGVWEARAAIARHLTRLAAAAN